jgi:signal transduction histidine kinase
VTLQAFLEWLTQGSIVLLAILMVAQWLRWRDRVSLDILLVFGSLGLLLVIERSLRLAQLEPPWLRPLGITVLLAHPFLLLRVINHFRPVSPALRRIAAAWFALAMLPTWIAVRPFRSAPLVVAAFVYFTWLLVYVAWAFGAGAKSTGGVTHWRMRHAALGASMLAALILLAVVIFLVPLSRVVASPLVPLAGLGAALNYYVAFAPPPWLRRLWQSAELYGLLSTRGDSGHSPSDVEVLNRLCAFTVPAVGARAAAAALWDEDQQQLSVAVSRWGYLEPGRPVPEGQLLDAWRANRAKLVKQHEWVLPGGAPGSVYVVPIPCQVGPAGVLFVVLPKSALFVADDLALLRVCCSETAVQLDNVTLRERQQALIRQLGERSDQLAQVNRELEAFSYSVSHDLRAPVRHISGFAQLLERSSQASLNPDGRRYLRLIAESAAKMGQLIDSLLVFSRMGRAEMLHSRVDLDAVVRAAQRDVMQGEPQRQITWDIKPLPVVPGDPNMLQLVFTNLLSNAVKYSRNRPDPVIEVGTATGNGSESIVFVKDNGVGFDMTYASRLFGVFQRLHRTEEFEGTGIGLANVQRIVARHGGRVWAEAELGKGAAFYVALPNANDVATDTMN